MNKVSRIFLFELLFLAGCTTNNIATTPTGGHEPLPAAAQTATLAPQEETLSVNAEVIASGFTVPVALVSPPDTSGRLFVVEQGGIIKIIDPQYGILPEPFLDLRERLIDLRTGYDERGLLGLVFHPEFEKNGRFFVYYTAPLRENAPEDWDHTNYISEFGVLENNVNLANPDSEKVILQIDQPYYSHDGGQIAFGPDGYLYIGTGDGGPGGDPYHHAQSLESLLGKILRIDVDLQSPYAIPADNPFVGEDGLDEIYAYGLRQPYRFSFDSAGSHELFVADVGHDLWEEINIISPGGNYGWNVREGTDCFKPKDATELFSTCADIGSRGEAFINPILQYDRKAGLAVIGGFVYRGEAIPYLYGRYIFADWLSTKGTLFTATPPQTENQTWAMNEVKIANMSFRGTYVLGLGTDKINEIYLLTTRTYNLQSKDGQVLKLTPAQ
ncbi:MAG: PQQ-dependent sugar dehydrogenase [Anaerolineales bacterium]|nr:PQQ-dependent sugar dehydrogenase [Chloroflexota bacterium]MBK6645797.1 PQQ-dependent sugar dehydrogenase [Anaerolineales bacterium]